MTTNDAAVPTYRGRGWWVLLLLAVLYAKTLAPSISWQQPDSAELALAAQEAGIAHPPGYPVYLMVAHLWQMLPLAADVAQRLNLLSAACMLLAAAGVASLIQRIAVAHHLPHSDQYATAGLFIFATAPPVWSLALVTEVYAMGLALLAGLALLVWSLVKQPQSNYTGWKLISLGALFGVSYGVMPLLLGLVVPLLPVIWRLSRTARRQRLQMYALLTFGIACGLGTFVYLPLRALNDTPLLWSLHWGQPDHWIGFRQVVTGAPYHHLAGISSVAGLATRLQAMMQIVTAALHYWALIPAAYGIIWLWRREALYTLFALGSMAISATFFLLYQADDADVYLLPLLLCLSVYTGIGLAAGIAQLQRRWYQRGVLLIITGALLLHTAYWYPQLNHSRDANALIFAVRAIDGLPSQAVILTDTDDATFALWYGRMYTRRADVAVVDVRLLSYGWYREHLRARHPRFSNRALSLEQLALLDSPLYQVQGQPPQYAIKPLRLSRIDAARDG